MKNLPIRDLEPGMIVAEAIYTSRGQLVMEEETVLTAELISRLSFYSIYNVTIKDAGAAQAGVQTSQENENAEVEHAPFTDGSQEDNTA